MPSCLILIEFLSATWTPFYVSQQVLSGISSSIDTLGSKKKIQTLLSVRNVFERLSHNINPFHQTLLHSEICSRCTLQAWQNFTPVLKYERSWDLHNRLTMKSIELILNSSLSWTCKVTAKFKQPDQKTSSAFRAKPKYFTRQTEKTLYSTCNGIKMYSCTELPINL